MAEPTTNMTEPAPLRWGPPWLWPVTHRTQVDMQWLVVAAAMTASAVVFFGWRALLGVIIVVLAALTSFVAVRGGLRLVGSRRVQDSSLHVLVLAMLLALVQPVTADVFTPMVSGLLLGLFAHIVGRSHRVRVHPVALVMLMVCTVPEAPGGWALSRGRPLDESPTQAVLRPDSLLFGDVRYGDAAVSDESWFATADAASDAVLRDDPYALLLRHQRRMVRSAYLDVLVMPQVAAQRARTVRGHLCSLREVLVGCVPGPAGATAKALLIVLGLYLIYRRLAWWPMIVVGFAAAVLAHLLAPMRIDQAWTIAGAGLLQQDQTYLVAYFSYMLLASPLVLMLMILGPLSAPIGYQGKLVYGLLLGSGVVACQWILPTAHAAYIALVIVGLLSRPLDRLHRSPFVVASD